MNFPYPIVILRHWRDLETQQERKKKAFAQGLNGGKRSRRTPQGCLARKNAKIPEVVKVNNYHRIFLTPVVKREIQNIQTKILIA
jgi:hypothetical protein